MDTTTQVLSLFILVITLAIVMLNSGTVRQFKMRPPLRKIAAYDNIMQYIGRSIESSNPIGISFGSTAIGDSSTILTVVSAELAYQITQRVAIGDTAPILTMSDASTLPIAQDTLRRAYQTHKRLKMYSYSNVRWYPSGSRSLAYAAALTALVRDDDISSHIFAGRFGAELALPMNAGVRLKIPSIAVTDDLAGQAVAYAYSDDVLIGEELFTAASYLGKENVEIAATISLDLMRWLIIIFIVIIFGLRLASNGG